MKLWKKNELLDRGLSENINLVFSSPLFDEAYYSGQKGNNLTRADAIKDYLLQGYKKGYDPSKLFSTNYYLSTYPDVKSSGMNPLIHYIKYGMKEGRLCVQKSTASSPYVSNEIVAEIAASRLFDLSFYNRQVNRDLSLVEAVSDYLSNGANNNLDPSSKFSTSYYLTTYPDVKTSGMNPLIHYICYGKNEKRQPLPTPFQLHHDGSDADIINLVKASGLFDLEFYNNQTKQQLSLNDAVVQYLTVGVEKGYDPSSAFSTYFYLAQYPDVKDNGINPLLHYILYGKEEGRKARFEYQISSLLLHDGIDAHSVSKCYSMDICASQTKAPEISWIKSDDELSGIDDRRFSGITYIGKTNIENLPREKVSYYFKDECIMAVLLCNAEYCSNINRNEPITMNEFIEKAVDFDSLYFDTDHCFFRSSMAGLKYNKEIWHSDNVFTDYILDLCSMGKIVLIDQTPDIQVSVNNSSVDEKSKRFISISNNYAISSKKLMEMFHELTDNLNDKDKEKTVAEISSGICAHDDRVIISLYGFSFGGGELMPIQLANGIKAMNIPVLVHIFDKSCTDMSVRTKLRSDIPVIYTKDPTFLQSLSLDFSATCINTHHISNQLLVSDFKEGVSRKIFHIATTHGMYNSIDPDYLKLVLPKVVDKVDYWTYVAEKNLIPFKTNGCFNRQKFFKVPNGEEVPAINHLDDENQVGDQAIVLCLVSRAIPEKGWKVAIEATGIARQKSGKDIVLYLVGDGEVFDEIKNDHPSYVMPVGFRENPYDYISRADIGILPSTYEGESAPLSIIEMLQCNKPVIATDIGDIREMLTYHGELCGRLIPLEDTGKISAEVLADNIIDLADNPLLMQHIKEIASLKKNEFSLENIVRKYLFVYKLKDGSFNSEFPEVKKRISYLYMAEFQKECAPKVSVIVPNYNYAKLLKRRLDCIYNQTYKNFEVILLDDHSADNSVVILSEYEKAHHDNTKLILNDGNSRGVICQWKKGIEAASGEICWIAEADDWCKDNFLETLVPLLSDPDIRIAYGKYVFAKDESHINEFAYSEYLSSLGIDKWERNYVNDADHEVLEALGKKNTLVNVSGLIFRKPLDCPLFTDESWLKMRICGDWMFYLYILKKGKIAYTAEEISYFRIGDANSAGASVYNSDRYYSEHAEIARELVKLYNVPDSIVLDNYNNVKEFCDSRNVADEDRNRLLSAYNISDILSDKRIKEESNCDFKELPVFVISNYDGGNHLRSQNDTFESVGLNTGNLVFDAAIEQEISACKILNIKEVQELGTPYCGNAVLSVANLINLADDTECDKYYSLFHNWQGNITVVGLGSQATNDEETPEELVAKLSPKRFYMIRMFSRRTNCIAIRGKFTAQCLDAMGIENYSIIGCPSVYMFGSKIGINFPKPKLDHVLISVTKNSYHGEYKACEEKIIQFGFLHHAYWCIQMSSEMPQGTLNKVNQAEALKPLLPRMEIDDSFCRWISDNSVYFFDIDGWNDWLDKQSFSFAIGTRFHGNMNAFLHGVPTLWITHDNRTAELIETLHLPHISKSELLAVESMDQLLAKWNCDDFISNYQQLYSNYQVTLKRNGVTLGECIGNSMLFKLRQKNN